MLEDINILVVGAGPVGLTAALALARAGVDVRVVDAADAVDNRMRASTFHPPTLGMIERLGLVDQLVDQGLKVPHFQMRQHETGERVVFDLGAVKAFTAHPYRLQVEQHRYCALALDALASLGVDVKFGNGMMSLIQDTDTVVATTENGEIRANWMIGADGAASTVRKSLGLEYGGKTHTHSSVLVSTPFPFHEHIRGISNVSYCWSERGPFSLLRLRNFWRASLYPGVEDLVIASEEDRIRDWLAYIHPHARDAEILDVNPYRVHERCVDQFRVGRVLLAGDAAHLNPPSGGMGMNGGIHDAMNLAVKLFKVLNGASDDLLDQYDRQRRTLASQRIIPQASENRARMATMDRTSQLARLDELNAIASDPVANRDFLLKSSMIAGLREADAID